ncbi:hypothetical protein NDQ53_18705 [Rossellomorea marisflavi]|uniref:hypothetical protein n=1 Tax=Rossellomorea marisflavi TaxID=189381 RepID=UPI00203E4728|nr:hypothetical protein [Rossellomorea marisflavi]
MYVTDDKALMRDVENLAKMDTDSQHVSDSIDNTISLMLQDSPQGREINNGENANGEMSSDYEMQDDDVHQINPDKIRKDNIMD